MSDEEKEAYKKCKEFAYIKMSPLAEAVDILLNLIEKQEKAIDLMAEDIYENDNFYKLKCAFEKVEKGKEKEYIKERFYAKEAKDE